MNATLIKDKCAQTGGFTKDSMITYPKAAEPKPIKVFFNSHSHLSGCVEATNAMIRTYSQ